MNAEASSEAPRYRGASLVAAIAFLPIFTAVLYLNGWVYHEGYLDYFHLPSSMFPLDLQATLVNGVFAWLNGGAAALAWISHSVVRHWGWILVGILGFASFVPLRRFFLAFLRTKRLPTLVSKWRLPAWMTRLLLELLQGASVTYLVLYMPFAMLSMTLIVLLVLVAPFQSVGRDIAMKDAQKGFFDSPVVHLTGQDGPRQSFRVMRCDGPFCALYASGHAVVVLRDSLTWAISPLAGPIQPPAK